jgi:hypothetical protein
MKFLANTDAIPSIVTFQMKSPYEFVGYAFPALSATTSFPMPFSPTNNPYSQFHLCVEPEAEAEPFICFSEPHPEEVLHKSKEPPSIREDYLWANTQKPKKLTLYFSMLATTSRK